VGYKDEYIFDPPEFKEFFLDLLEDKTRKFDFPLKLGGENFGDYSLAFFW
jgi:hypothetical protein